MRSRRSARAVGVARSLGASPARTIQCAVCKRWLPRDAIAHITRKRMTKGPHKGQPVSVCGECWHSGRVWSDSWEW